MLHNSDALDTLLVWSEVEDAIERHRRDLGVSRRPLQMLLRLAQHGGEAPTPRLAQNSSEHRHLRDLQELGLVYTEEGAVLGSRALEQVLTEEGQRAVRTVLETVASSFGTTWD